MATNYIYPFAQNATGTDILTDANYQSDSQRPIGNQPGIARLELVNKALRSDSVLAAALAQFIADNQTSDVHDGLSLTTLVQMFNTALNNAGLDAQTLNGQLASYYTNITARLGYIPAHLAGDSTQAFSVADATGNSEAASLGQLNTQIATRAPTAGSSNQTFDVANATTSSEAVNLGQLNSATALFTTVTDQTANRTSGTTYTNSSGKPMLVVVVKPSGDSTGLSLIVNGTTVSSRTGNQYDYEYQASCIVPVGATYKATGSIQSFIEVT